jgi:ABC-type multidrug transport system ATPase subunit
MLKTDHEPSDGCILIRQKDGTYLNALQNNKTYWNQIGYCPQFDALYDELTAVEHLKLFCALKGIKKKNENYLCECLLKRLDLVHYANRPCGQLSLGNKRKLSTALALVGNPSIILLDEPTSGQDPVSRRRLWKEIINLTKQKNRSVLLTSHSMEECEALCSRIAIMTEGNFRCMGSVQHLKSKFGEGYTLTIKFREEKQPSLNENKYVNLILKELKVKISHECKLKERNFNNVYQFELPSPNNSFSIGDVYRLVELNKLKFSIIDYSLSQNTLDNVFINFVKEQIAAESSKTVQNLDENESQQQKSSISDNRKAFKNKKSSDLQFPIHDETDDLLLSLENDSDDYNDQLIIHDDSNQSCSRSKLQLNQLEEDEIVFIKTNLDFISNNNHNSVISTGSSPKK